MKRKIQKETWYSDLVDECKGLITEGVFNSRWILIETYHKVGELLRNETRMEISKLLSMCAVDMGVSERKLWYAVEFYDKYPKLDELPEGKNISWTKIKTKYLTEGKETKEDKERCPTCGRII